MAIQEFQNGELLATVREKINTNFTTLDSRVTTVTQSTVDTNQAVSLLDSQVVGVAQSLATVTQAVADVTQAVADLPTPEPVVIPPTVITTQVSPALTGIEYKTADAQPWAKLFDFSDIPNPPPEVFPIAGGFATKTIGGTTYAMLPTNLSGGVTASVSHRKGLEGNLLTLSGGDGEIGITTDTNSLVIFNGVPGGAKTFKRLNNVEGLGEDSLAIGPGASTLGGANRSVALGSYAQAEVPGQVAMGGQIDGLSRSFITLGLRTDNDDFVQLSTDATIVSAHNSPRLVRDGIFDVTAVILARKVGTNSWARFEQRAVVRKTGSSTTMSTPTTPTPDINSGLTGITATLGAAGGGLLYVAVEGLATEPVQWGAYLTINALNLNV